jgi:hypothetical protein
MPSGSAATGVAKVNGDGTGAAVEGAADARKAPGAEGAAGPREVAGEEGETDAREPTDTDEATKEVALSAGEMADAEAGLGAEGRWWRWVRRCRGQP